MYQLIIVKQISYCLWINMLWCADGYYLLNVSIYRLIMLYCPQINMLQCADGDLPTYISHNSFIISNAQSHHCIHKI